MSRGSILRTLRTKLRNGWVKEAPPEYFHLIRNPPVNVDLAKRDSQVKDIPYAKYLHQAREKSAKYNSETVYPAFWQDEPLSLILAKKQYELVKSGMSEEDAYTEAEKFAEKIEQDAFDTLQSLSSSLQSEGARLPFASDKSIAVELAKWKRILAKYRYDQLSDADQGEIDYFVQSKILKWNEVERSRRMSDPVFVAQFDKFRAAVLPEIAESQSKDYLNGRDEFKKQQLSLLGLSSLSQLQTSAPFYYDDYVHFFNRLKDQPYLGKWTERNRDKLARWIVDTLAFKAKLEGKSRIEVQISLDALRAQYFPMIRQPHRAQEYILPSVDKMRALLYNNDIGYKTEEGRLFVHRFYKIPVLLFPKETLTAMFTADHQKLQAVVKDDNYLLREMEQAGMDRSKLDDVKAELLDYYNSNVVPQYNESPVIQSGIDMSIIDDLLRDDVEAKDLAESIKAKTIVDDSDSDSEVPAARAAPTTAAVAALKGDDLFEEPIEIVPRVQAEPLPEPVLDDKLLDAARLKYKFVATSVLEQQRIAQHEEVELEDWRTAKTDIALDTIAAQRIERDAIFRARCALAFERKEAARRQRDWKRRGVVDPDVVATNSLELRDSNRPKA